jgi:hypothetical protein
LYSASQDGITPDTLRRAGRRLKVKAKAREGRARGGWLWGFAGMFEDVAEDVQQQQNAADAQASDEGDPLGP